MIRALQGSSAAGIGVSRGCPVFFRLSKNKPLAEIADSTALPTRSAATIEQIRSLRADFGFVVDMWDRRIRSVSDGSNPPYPVFSFNRLTGEPGRILWPLAGFHDIDGPGFLGKLDPGRIDWVQKLPRLVWRGGTGGRHRGSGAGRGEGMRVISAIRRFKAGKLDKATLKDVISGAHRYQVLDRFKDDDRFDLGFVDSPDYIISETPFHAHLEKPRLNLEEMQNFRYIAVLRGNDVGSSFYWTMNSGSVGFVQDTPYETFASGHFRPWEHYIPFAEDGSDLAQQLDWAEAHQDECRAMAARAAAVCALLARPDLRAAVLDGVVSKVREAVD